MVATKEPASYYLQGAEETAPAPARTARVHRVRRPRRGAAAALGAVRQRPSARPRTRRAGWRGRDPAPRPLAVEPTMRGIVVQLIGSGADLAQAVQRIRVDGLAGVVDLRPAAAPWPALAGGSAARRHGECCGRRLGMMLGATAVVDPPAPAPSAQAVRYAARRRLPGRTRRPPQRADPASRRATGTPVPRRGPSRDVPALAHRQAGQSDARQPSPPRAAAAAARARRTRWCPGRRVAAKPDADRGPVAVRAARRRSDRRGRAARRRGHAGARRRRCRIGRGPPPSREEGPPRFVLRSQEPVEDLVFDDGGGWEEIEDDPDDDA